ncbi:MAG: hypothetical protein HY020_02965 [Burkholderiales bacterium]|nr:hypothetical protein [Burkholderiales bacterium]
MLHSSLRCNFEKILLATIFGCVLTNSVAAADEPNELLLLIDGLSFYGDSSPNHGEKIEIKAIVNGTSYTVEGWCCNRDGKISLNNQKPFALPKGSSYSVRFELLRGSRAEPSSSNVSRVYNAKGFEFSTHETPQRRWFGLAPISEAKAAPVVGEYSLYEVRNGTRDAAVSAVVRYELVVKK